MTRPLLAAASLLALAAGPAAALTGPELWADWQETMARLGGTLTAEAEERDGDRLVLRRVAVEQTIAGSSSDTVYGDVTLIDQADGSVRVEYPERMSIRTETQVEGQSATMELEMVSEGVELVVRDEGEARVYDMRGARFAYDVADVTSGLEDDPVTMSAAMTDFTSTTRIEGEDAYAADFDGGLTIDVTQAGAEPFTFAYATDSLSGEMTGTIPDMAAMAGEEIPDLSALGLEYDMDFAHEGSTLTVSAQTPDGALSIDGSAASGGVRAGMSATALDYEVRSTEAAYTVVPPGLPLPVNLSVAESRSGLSFPIAPGEDGAAQPFGLTTVLRDLAIDDALWSLFDPTGQLPRDPATMVIALEGEADVLYSLFDPEMSGNPQPPFMPVSLNVTEVLVSAVGAELRAAGAMTFPGGVENPQPEGEVTVELDGAYGLLDKLVALGFVPPQQVAIVRGMAGAVAEQVGDDQLRSVLGFGPGGVTANGLPLPF